MLGRRPIHRVAPSSRSFGYMRFASRSMASARRGFGGASTPAISTMPAKRTPRGHLSVARARPCLVRRIVREMQGRQVVSWPPSPVKRLPGSRRGDLDSLVRPSRRTGNGRPGHPCTGAAAVPGGDVPQTLAREVFDKTTKIFSANRRLVPAMPGWVRAGQCHPYRAGARPGARPGAVSALPGAGPAECGTVTPEAEGRTVRALPRRRRTARPGMVQPGRPKGSAARRTNGSSSAFSTPRVIPGLRSVGLRLAKRRSQTDRIVA